MFHPEWGKVKKVVHAAPLNRVLQDAERKLLDHSGHLGLSAISRHPQQYLVSFDEHEQLWLQIKKTQKAWTILVTAEM